MKIEFPYGVMLEVIPGTTELCIMYSVLYTLPFVVHQFQLQQLGQNLVREKDRYSWTIRTVLEVNHLYSSVLMMECATITVNMMKTLVLSAHLMSSNS